MNLMTASAQWASRPADQRFETLQALRDSVHNRRLRSRSVDLDLTRIQVKDQDSTLVINSGVSPCEPSHWVKAQCDGMLKAPANYLRSLPPSRYQLKKAFPRGCQVTHLGNRLGEVTGYGRESAHPGMVIVRFRNTSTPRLVRWADLTLIP